MADNKNKCPIKLSEKMNALQIVSVIVINM